MPYRHIWLAVWLSLVFANGHLSAATLYGVTGDGSAQSESLFTINTADAGSTLVTALGNGDDGEAIAFNPNDGLIYHWSGADVFEAVDPDTHAVTEISLSGDSFGEVTGATFDPSSGNFLVVDLGNNLYTITVPGTSTGPLGISQGPQGTGLAFVGDTLYEVFRDTDEISTVNPVTGAILTSTTITLAGESVTAATGLATEPGTNKLFALLKLSGQLGRELATIDPTTGVATSIGNTGLQFADIAFTPEPTTLTLVTFGMLGMLCVRRKRS